MIQPTWITPAGTLGGFPALIPLSVQLTALPALPATAVTYKLLSGSLPSGLTITTFGLITGTPDLATEESSMLFTVRVTDNLNNIKDRTFSMTVTGFVSPKLTTPPGNILSVNDSTWVELQLSYDNPIPSNPIEINVLDGALPPGLEMNSTGLIRGYAEPPIETLTLYDINSTITGTNGSTNELTCLSTAGFRLGRPIRFSGTLIGGLSSSLTYYIKTVVSNTNFTIAATQDGSVVQLVTAIGFMVAYLPNITIGQPTIKTYNFNTILRSPLGTYMASYSITVTNQRTPNNQGGPGLLANNRKPTIYNTRPPKINLSSADSYYGYYLLPNEIDGTTYPSNESAFMGTFTAGDYFSFKVIGHDFDGTNLQYEFSGLPDGLSGNLNTGWITGTPIVTEPNLTQYSFSVIAHKISNPAIKSSTFNFKFNISNVITPDVTWVTPSNLGTLLTSTICTKNVLANADVPLEYSLVDGSLPSTLTLLSNGEIVGYVADEPNSNLLPLGGISEFSFTIRAYSPDYPLVTSDKTFKLSVQKVFEHPTDTVYIKATPSISNRKILETLLTDDSIIPPEYLYRPSDAFFGKATSVTYEHAYGIYASDINQYLDSVTKNHYNRNITLGELKTAVAKNEFGETIYEVVYSQIIDDLINPKGISVSQEISWPRRINLNLGPWYSSATDIYTSYVNVLSQDYYTSLSPGSTRILYPNSLPNMRNRVAQVLGLEDDSRLLPLWMTSQQSDGSTLGYVQAWVICYTKPGFSATIKENIETMWTNSAGKPYTLNQIGFNLDRFAVNKTLTYNYDNSAVPPAWTGLPSATPAPNPINSKDFYVLFPRATILPDNS